MDVSPAGYPSRKSEFNIDCDTFGDCDIDHRGGHGEVLQADAGAVEEGDLLARAAAGVGAVDDGADLGDRRSRAIRPPATACWASPIEIDWATSSVKTVAAATSAASTSCLPLVSVPMQARWVPGLTWARHQDRGEARGDGDDDVGLGAEAVEVDRLEGQAELRRRCRRGGTASRGGGSSRSTLSKSRWRAAARIWKADWWPAPTMPSTLASLRRQVLDRDGGGGGGAGGGQVVAADHGRRPCRCRGRRGRPSTGGCRRGRARGCAASSRRP